MDIDEEYWTDELDLDQAVDTSSSSSDDPLDDLLAAGAFEPSATSRELFSIKSRPWVDPILADRNSQGMCAVDLAHLVADPRRFEDDFHMKIATFEYIYEAVKTDLEHESRWRECISSRDRLIVALQ